MSGKRGYFHRNEHFLHVFDAFEREIYTISVPLPGFGITGTVLQKYYNSLLFRELEILYLLFLGLGYSYSYL